VLIHAGIADSRMWDPQFDRFAADHRVIRYDVRGCGQSPNPPGEYDDVDDLYDLLAHLQVESAVLIGCSNGGSIAVDFTLTYPDMVRRLVLVGASISGHEVDASIQEGWDREDEAYENGGIFPAVELALRMWVDGPKRTPDEVYLFLPERVREMLFGIYRRLDEGEQGDAAALEPPAYDRLHEIEAPTLVVVGALDHADRIKLAESIVARMPHARLAVVENVAHLASLEQPEEFNTKVGAFLAEQA
jgi:pimeloyl-ACP methyl ester carboxylesterase